MCLCNALLSLLTEGEGEAFHSRREGRKRERDKPGSAMSMFVGCCASGVIQSAIPVEAGGRVPSNSIDAKILIS